MELSPVKEFFNNKLKQLQENLKQMAALRREAEAAGTKKRLLRWPKRNPKGILLNNTKYVY